jgi:hypothetical protein
VPREHTDSFLPVASHRRPGDCSSRIVLDLRARSDPTGDHIVPAGRDGRDTRANC